MGFDWVWLLSVWQTGQGAQKVSRTNRDWRREFQETLPDLREEISQALDSPSRKYRVHEGLGGDAALARLRERMRHRGLKLMLDFVPTIMGLDHLWVEEPPEFLSRAPEHLTGPVLPKTTLG